MGSQISSQVFASGSRPAIKGWEQKGKGNLTSYPSRDALPTAVACPLSAAISFSTQGRFRKTFGGPGND